MDYHRIYREFIADRKAKPKPDGYTERHHILPRALGGGDDFSNLIALTAREHYFAHCCLAKIHGGKMWSALAAVAAMAKQDDAWRYFCRRRMVAAARENAAYRRRQHMTELWASGAFKRNRQYRAWTEEEREKRRMLMLGRKTPRESIEKARATRLQHAPSYSYIHLDGRQFCGTQSDFRLFSGLSQPMVSCLTRRKIISAKGWLLKGSDERARNGRDPKVRRFFHKSGDAFDGTVHEFRMANPQVDRGSLSKLVNGKLGSVNGWRLARTGPSES